MSQRKCLTSQELTDYWMASNLRKEPDRDDPMTGVLDAKEHSRIIADFERVCTMAGIQGHFLYESMTKHCGPAEVDWVKRFWSYLRQGVPGLVLEGVTRPDTRCQSIAAALVRNYVDARVVPLNTLIDSTMDGGHAAVPHGVADSESVHGCHGQERARVAGPGHV